MTLDEFRDLPFGIQVGLLLREGIPLMTRSVGNQQRVLFSVHTHYVEASWNRWGELQFLRSFRHTDGLEPYLARLDWQLLVSQ